MPLADVMTFYMATPLIVTALSAPLLGEKVERFRWIAVMVGFVGVLIALRPSPQMFSWAAPIALFGATTFALEPDDHPRAPRRPLAAAGLLAIRWQRAYRRGDGSLGLDDADGFRSRPHVPRWLVSMTCFIFIVRALALARAAVLAPLQYSAIVWAAIWAGWSGATPDAADRHRQRHHHRQRAIRRGAGQDDRRRGRVRRSSECCAWRRLAPQPAIFTLR